ncbi:MAG TPA: DUF433 domain-containing protein [Longimicrobium sp.]|nr:DUF433 domain-containing protein [Longimicrobium sp.]
MTEYIVRDGETGRALVASTGTPVDEILEALEAGGGFQSALARHPDLTAEAVAAALRFARTAVTREVQYLPKPGRGFTGVRERAVSPFNGGASAGTVTSDGQASAGFWQEEPDLVADVSLAAELRSAEARREQLLYDLDLIEGIIEGLEDVAAGRVIPHEEAMAFLRSRITG